MQSLFADISSRLQGDLLRPEYASSHTRDGFAAAVAKAHEHRAAFLGEAPRRRAFCAVKNERSLYLGTDKAGLPMNHGPCGATEV